MVGARGRKPELLNLPIVDCGDGMLHSSMLGSTLDDNYLCFVFVHWFIHTA